MYAAVLNGKKGQAIFLIRLPFSHRTNRSLSFVRLFTKKQTVVNCLQTDGLNGLNELAHV
jgi:hypothetical protein